MSIQARQWARGRPPSRRLAAVLFILCDYADAHGVAWVAQTTLAHDCCCSQRTILRHLAELEDARLIARVHTRDRLGRQGRDMTVLAPGAADRGPLSDAPNGDYPAAVVELARASQGDKPGNPRVTNRARQGDKPGQARVTNVSGRDSAETPAHTDDPGFGAEQKNAPNVVNVLKATPPPPAELRTEARATTDAQQQQGVVVEEKREPGENVAAVWLARIHDAVGEIKREQDRRGSATRQMAPSGKSTQAAHRLDPTSAITNPGLAPRDQSEEPNGPMGPISPRPGDAK